MSNSMDKIRRMLCREIDEIAEKGELSAGDLQSIHTLTDTIKNIDKIDMIESGDYSEAMSDMDARDSYRRGYGRSSYGRHYVRGHYSNNDRRYSMNDARSYIADEIDQMLHGEIQPGERAALERALRIIRDA